MNNLDPQELLLQFGHWVVVGVSVIVIIGVLALGGDERAEKALELAEKNFTQLKASANNSSDKNNELPDYLKQLKNNWRLHKKTLSAPTQDSFYEKAKITFKHAVPPTRQWISKPQNLELEVGRESINISWDPPPPLPGKEMTETAGYFLLKRWEIKGQKYTKIFEFSEIDNSYQDKKVESKIDYFYKVAAYTENKKAKGGTKIHLPVADLVLSDDTKERLADYKKIRNLSRWVKQDIVTSALTPEKKGHILPLYDIQLLGIGGDVAFIKLLKWEKGKWRSAVCRIRKGDKIMYRGKIPEIGRVNWNPGWTIKYVNLRSKKLVVRKVKEAVKDKNGRVQIDRETKQIIYRFVDKKEIYRVPAIGYVDDKGARHIVYTKSKSK